MLQKKGGSKTATPKEDQTALSSLAVEYLPKLLSYMSHIKTSKQGGCGLSCSLSCCIWLLVAIYVRSSSLGILFIFFFTFSYPLSPNSQSPTLTTLCPHTHLSEMGVVLLDILCYLIAIEQGSLFSFLSSFSSSLLHLPCPEWPQACQEIVSRLCHFVLPTCLGKSFTPSLLHSLPPSLSLSSLPSLLLSLPPSQFTPWPHRYPP